MKKKIIIGAIALMGVFGGLTAWQSLSGQNEVKAHVLPVHPRSLPATMHVGWIDCGKPDRDTCYYH